jgi:hypothetical protein
MSEQRSQEITGAKTPHGQRRPPYVRNPETSRDFPARSEVDTMRGRSGSKVWRKAREGKL